MIGAVFYEVLGGAPSRASFVSGLVVVAWVDTAILILAAALTFLLPRRAASPASRSRASGWPAGAAGRPVGRSRACP